MARKWFAFLCAVESILKGVRSWVGFFLRRGLYRRVMALSLLSLFLTVGIPPVLSQIPALKPTLLAQDNAQSLVQQSEEKYKNGMFPQAIELLRQAVTLFEAQGQSRNRAITLVNLGRMQSELGQYYQACETLTQAIGLSSDVCEDKDLPKKEPQEWVSEPLKKQDLVQVNSLRIFGDVLRAIGRLEQSEQILKRSLEIVDSLSSSPEQTEARIAIILSLGNTFLAQGNLERDRQAPIQYEYEYLPWHIEQNTEKIESYKKAEIQYKCVVINCTTIQTVDEAYKQVVMSKQPLSLTGIKAQLNLLSLFLETGQLQAAQKLSNVIDLSNLPVSRTKIYAEIKLAKSLAYLEARKDAPFWDNITKQIKIAIEEAEKLGDKRAESYARGNLGGFCEYLGKHQHQTAPSNWKQEAQRLTQDALYLAQPSKEPDIAYQWQWQLGRLLEAEDKREEAITAYEAAVKTLESVREDLLTINSDVQFSFRDNVEPVYRELVELLLRPEKKSELGKNIEEKPKPKSENLKKAIKNIDTLRLAELENFFRCNLVKPEQIDQISDSKTAVIYPVLLKNKLAIIFQLLGQDQSLTYEETNYTENNLTKDNVENFLNQLRENLSESDTNPEVLQQSRTLYQWLIQPIEKILSKNNQVETLVFVPDALLRDIPIAALYNGQEYLVQRYAIATAPSLKIFLPKASGQRLSFLIGGVGLGQNINSKEFPEINKELNKELNQTLKNFTASKPLVDENFTLKNIQQQLKSGKFSAIHWKTHGEFSSDPENTYIVAHETLIKAKELSNLIQVSRKIRGEPLELLVLSACSTAQGDNRAVLGLGGIAARAGVRSVLSTLWPAKNNFDTEFMARFYEKLSQGVTKAQAVRDTQRDFISEGRYEIPYYWANYVLVGNWL
ncbi:MAG: CHAT domain-containing protein [Symploca sp. SIO2G7]|nr:CHAT domain-containing protein [Symploca sp. SIO2G7]